MAFITHLLELLVLLFSTACSFPIQKGISPGRSVRSTLYFGIGSGRVNVVCPVTALSHTILEPSASPRFNGSFRVEGLDEYESGLFSLVHVEEACWVSPNAVTAASEELCDRVYIINTKNPNRKGNFSVLYDSSNGTVIITKILYGPEGVTLANSIPEDGTPLFIGQGTTLEYELRIRSFRGQSSPNPMLCERMKNGQFSQSSSFFLLPNINSLGCQQSLNDDGFSMPSVTTVLAGNLSLLFSDPSAIYLVYGSCNFTDGEVSSTIYITATAESTTLSNTDSMPTSVPTSNDTATTSHPAAPPSTAVPGSTLPGTTVGLTTNGMDLSTTDDTTDSDGIAVSGMTSNDVLTPSTGPVAEVTQATTLRDSTHSGSTHIATSIEHGPLHLRDWAVVGASLVTSVLIVVVIIILVVLLCTTVRRWKKKSVLLQSPKENSEPEIKVKDPSPVLSIPCPVFDSDSGVVAGSAANGGTPVSNCNFTMSGTEKGPPACTNKGSSDHRESDLTDSSASSVQILKSVTGVGNLVHETKAILEDFRDTVYAGKLDCDQSPDES